MTTDINELVKRLRDGDCLDIGAAADALETLAKELYDARVVCGDTFDSARKWRARAEAAEAERDRLKEDLSVMHLKLEAKLSTEQSAEVTRLRKDMEHNTQHCTLMLHKMQEQHTAEAARLKAALVRVKQFTKGGPDHVSDDDITEIFKTVDAALGDAS